MIPAEHIETAHAADVLTTAKRFTTLKRAGVNEYVGPCPKCGGRDRFSVNTKKRIWNCRGCSKGGDVISLVRLALGIGFAEAVAELKGERSRPAAPPRQPVLAPDNGRMALDIFSSARSVRATPGEIYLIRRHVDLDQIPDLDNVLRFAPRCPFGDERLPCLVALVRNVLTNEPQAIQRTALDPDGRKIGRRSLGPTKGGAIKLWPDEMVTAGLVGGEGMETVASAATAIQVKGTLLQPAWALLDRVNLSNLPVLPGIEALTILVDNDESGDGQADAEAGARRWLEAGRDVIRLVPKKRGSDFNDIVRGAA